MKALNALRRRLNREQHRPLLPEVFKEGGLARRMLPEELRRAADSVRVNDQGHGIDTFGLSSGGAARGLAVTYLLYEHYFRVESHHAERIPAKGRAILACNHSGMLPLDAMMVSHDVMRHSTGHRAARIAMDYFVPGLPFVNLVFSRAGGVTGSRGNFHALLESDELIAVFPEGVPGIGKPFSERYKLQTWREGHAELAIRHGAPIVPMCVIGAEEQWPQVARIEGISVFGIPYMPIPATLLPMPVKYHIWYGEPVPIPDLYPREAAHDAVAVLEAAALVKAEVAKLIARGLEHRKGIFR